MQCVYAICLWLEGLGALGRWMHYIYSECDKHVDCTIDIITMLNKYGESNSIVFLCVLYT